MLIYFDLVQQALSSTLRSTLNSSFHALKLFTVSALESFVASIPVRHKDILPKCIPSKAQRIIHARLNGAVYLFDAVREVLCLYFNLSFTFSNLTYYFLRTKYFLIWQEKRNSSNSQLLFLDTCFLSSYFQVSIRRYTNELGWNPSEILVQKDSDVYTLHGNQKHSSAVIIIARGEESKVKCLLKENILRRHGFLRRVDPLIRGGFSLIIDSDTYKNNKM